MADIKEISLSVCNDQFGKIFHENMIANLKIDSETLDVDIN